MAAFCDLAMFFFLLFFYYTALCTVPFAMECKLINVQPVLQCAASTTLSTTGHSLRLNAELVARAWVILGSLIAGVKNILRSVIHDM